MAKERRKQRQADEQSGVDHKAQKAARKRARRAAAASLPENPGEEAAAAETVDHRLARIEKAVAAQTQVSEELLRKLDELLGDPPVARTGDEGMDQHR